MEFKTTRKINLNLRKLGLFFLLLTSLFLFLSVAYTWILIQYADKWQPEASLSNNQILERLQDKTLEISMFVTGDVMLGRTVMMKSHEMDDFAYPFRKVADVMRETDIVFVNLENPIIENCPPHEAGYVFCATPNMLEGLTFAGVDVVNLANNHTLNYGKTGLDQTLMHLQEENILATGVGELVVLERNGVTFGFLGFDKSEQLNPKLTQDEIDLITSSDKKTDVLVISMHWGVEYQDKALPGVRSLAKEIVGYGADLIVGHHPHWVQDWEFIDLPASTYADRQAGRKPVFYSLGNFVFDQMWSEQTKKGLAVKLIYDKEGVLTDYQLLPTYMSSWSQPEFIED